MKFGKDKGNSGAIIRWGKYLDNGIWVTKLWKRWRLRKGYIAIPFLTIQWNNLKEF